MSKETTDFAKENRDLIVEITQSVLSSEESPEVNYVGQFLDVYIDNLEKEVNDETSSTTKDVPLGLGGTELATLVLFPIIINLTTETYKKLLDKHNEKYWKEKGDQIEGLLIPKLGKKRAKKLAREIIKNISHKS